MSATEAAILCALNTGPKSESDLWSIVRGYLGTEPDDGRDVLDDLLDSGRVETEPNDYLQEDIYAHAGWFG